MTANKSLKCLVVQLYLQMLFFKTVVTIGAFYWEEKKMVSGFRFSTTMNLEIGSQWMDYLDF